MPAGLTKLLVVNRALTEIAKGNPIADLVSTEAGIKAALLYDGAVEMLLRQQDYEFSQMQVALTTAAGMPPAPFTNQYLYPADCLKVRQISPATWDENDPKPITWSVGTTLIATVPTAVVSVSVPAAMLIYTTSNVTETEWDSLFTEIMVRYLGSMLSIPLAGRPDFAKEMLKAAGGLMTASQSRDS